MITDEMFYDVNTPHGQIKIIVLLAEYIFL